MDVLYKFLLLKIQNLFLWFVVILKCSMFFGQCCSNGPIDREKSVWRNLVECHKKSRKILLSFSFTIRKMVLMYLHVGKLFSYFCFLLDPEVVTWVVSLLFFVFFTRFNTLISVGSALATLGTYA